MEVFASCLPGYIAKISQEERRGFMEGMVCDDDLWTSLQVNLWNAVRSDSPVPDKLRMFEACCIVIDAMFLALEDSDRVDWRAPHFGSLAQHFELFVTRHDLFPRHVYRESYWLPRWPHQASILQSRPGAVS